MSPVVTLQRRFRELGRVRMGTTEATGRTRRDGTPIRRPKALRQWRLTAYGDVGHALLTQAAAQWGGTVVPWENAPAGGGWELATESDTLDFIVPPVEEPFSVWLEKWSAGGCERRCDGERVRAWGGRGVGWRERACLCEDPTDPNKRECSIVMRFGIILPTIDGLGVWAVQTHSFHGAEELQGALSLLGNRAKEGIITPAKLRIEARQIKRQALKPNGTYENETSNFVVPVIDVEQTIGQLVSGEGDRIALPGARVAAGRPQLGAGAPPPPSTPLRAGGGHLDPPLDDPPPFDPSTGEVIEGVIVDPDPPGAGVSSPEEPTLGQEARKEAFRAWRALGFTDDEIRATMVSCVGVMESAQLTDSQRWVVEGELRRLKAERDAKGDRP